MCGIAGLWNLHGMPVTGPLQTMLDAMVHRGPDGRGITAVQGGAIGMVRLALVDLSERGQQPMWTRDEQVGIIFNGEMYNFREERGRLESIGHTFHSGTDTEVVLALYLERGLSFVDRLRGMYALAIVDYRQGGRHVVPRLLLARDPLGIKPLYVASGAGRPESVVFASEIRALLASGLVDRRVDAEGVVDYLSFGCVSQPRTIIAGVRMLMPGTVEQYSPGEPVTRLRFWKLPPPTPQLESFDEASARLRTILDQSVALHASADAKVGAFLSGGLDSTAIVGLMRRHVADLHTYTIRFPDVPGGESESAEAVEAARWFECRSTIVDVTGPEIAAALPRFAHSLDQPSIDGLNTWLVSRAAASDVKGVLSGLGGDEFFAGYPVVQRMIALSARPLGKAYRIAGRLSHLVCGLIPPGALRQRVENLAARRNAVATWSQSHEVFSREMAIAMTGRASRSCNAKQLEQYLDELFTDWRQESTIGLASALDTGVYLLNQLLRDSDATSMAHSLELRVPFVDIGVAEFSRNCIDAYKCGTSFGKSGTYDSSGTKRVLLHAVRDVLPPGLSQRRKRGFSLPHLDWLSGSLSTIVSDTCSVESMRNRGLFEPSAIARFQKQFDAGSLTPFPQVWALVIFELWCRAVLDVSPQIGNREFASISN